MTLLPIDLISWYMNAFVAEPERGYAQMNPPGAENKYSYKTQTLTAALVKKALEGGTRRLPIVGTWHTLPLSIAVTPMHRSGWAKAAALDIDSGGRDAIEQVLHTCGQQGLWAFAQLSHSDDHDGGHVYIPSAGSEPASLLLDIARRIQLAAGVVAETYPDNRSFRLPLMIHLRAPGGPKRFPLLLSTGERIDTSDVGAALQALQPAWQPNTADILMRALDGLPPLPVVTPKRFHKSKVNPDSDAGVIAWYNSNHGLDELLSRLGVTVAGRGHVNCPWHQDTHPSLSIWTHKETNQLVCHCYSANSNCPAAEGPYLDAFDVYCLMEHLSVMEAVKQLAEQHNLGQRRGWSITPTVTAESVVPEVALPPPTSLPAALADHQAIVKAARGKLGTELRTAAAKARQVTVIRASLGLGKTHMAAELANELHRTGNVVAIVAPTLTMAEEWNDKLSNGFIWRARLDICTCYPDGYLRGVAAKGYPLPDCFDGCPYEMQRYKRAGHVVIYQHNHLFLGALLVLQPEVGDLPH